MLEEPGDERGHTGVENSARCDGCDDGLGKEELIVFCRERYHHEAEDINDSAEPKEILGPIHIKKTAKLMRG